MCCFKPFVALLAAFFVGLLWLCAVAPGHAQQPSQPHRFTMGIYYPSVKSLISRVDFEVALDVWLQELSRAAGLEPASAKLFDEIAIMSEATRRGELDFVLAPPLLLAKYFDRWQLAEGYTSTTLDGNHYGMVLVARTDKHIRGFRDFAGKRLLLPDKDELAMLFLDTELAKAKMPSYPQVFSGIQHNEKYSGIVLGLFFDKADVGVVYQEIYQMMTELNPQIADVVKILATFPSKSPNYGFFNSAYPQPLRERIAESIRLLHSNVRMQQILTDLRMANLVACPIDELAPFDELLREHALLNRGRRP